MWLDRPIRGPCLAIWRSQEMSFNNIQHSGQSDASIRFAERKLFGIRGLTIRIRRNEICCNILGHEPGIDGSIWCFVLVNLVTSKVILFDAGIFIWDTLYPVLTMKAACSSYNCWIVSDLTASRSVMSLCLYVGTFCRQLSVSAAAAHCLHCEHYK
jgi:hypothetical protein